jgi:hypothetical protein
MSLAMSESAVNNQLKENKDKIHTTLLTERLEQLGYQCLSDSCDRFTTLRLIPVEIKRREEQLSPPVE